MTDLDLVSWNVLAAPWAGPAWYPDGMDPEVLDRVVRADRVAARLRAMAPAVACLQETTPPDLAAIIERIGDGWESHTASNHPTFWTNWLGADTEWEPNGTAVVWDPSRLVAIDRGVIDLADHGNTATWVQFESLGGDDVPLLVVSIHLDSDNPARRRTEVPALVDRVKSHARVVIAGDYNEDTLTSDLVDELFALGFVDAAALGECREPTHPVASPRDDWKSVAIIDHVLVRGLTVERAAVHDVGTWPIELPAARLEELLRRTGSDHLAVSVRLQSPGSTA